MKTIKNDIRPILKKWHNEEFQNKAPISPIRSYNFYRNKRQRYIIYNSDENAYIVKCDNRSINKNYLGVDISGDSVRENHSSSRAIVKCIRNRKLYFRNGTELEYII